MRKKAILIVVAVTVLGVLTYLGYKVITKAKEKHQIAQQLESIPEFEFLNIEQKSFTKANLKPNTNHIFIYFNSTCEFCQHEAQSISDNSESFKHVQFVFVSTEPIEVIKQFSEQYHLNQQPNITFLYDKLDIFSTRFDAKTIPYLLIYDEKQQLIKKHKGQLNAKGILSALQQND